MSPVPADVLQVTALIAALELVHRPLGDYMAAVFSSDTHLRIEKWIYRSVGVDPDAEMRWPAYLRGVLIFSAVGVVLLYVLQRMQDVLPLSLGSSRSARTRRSTPPRPSSPTPTGSRTPVNRP